MDERYAKLNERDPLVKLNQLIDWEAFREPLSMIHNRPRKSQASCRPCDVVLMFKIMVFQCLYNVSDLPAAGRPPGFVRLAFEETGKSTQKTRPLMTSHQFPAPFDDYNKALHRISSLSTTVARQNQGKFNLLSRS